MARPEAAAPAAPAGAIPALDGIRALAVSLVFFAHGGFGHLVPGGLGVTIFFVLSGYLITTLMRQEFARDGSISLRNFYLRRCLRLMPPLLVVAAAAALLSAIGIVEGDFSISGLLAVLFYFGNYHVILHDFHGLPSGLGVIWSLAVEEHYYLLYPPLALLLLRLRRPGVAGLLLALACAGVLARRCWLVAHGGSEAYIEMATDTRIDAILVGCLLGLRQNPWLDAQPGPRDDRRDALTAALCLGLLLISLLIRNEGFRLTLRYTVQSLAIAPLLYLAVARAGGGAWRWLDAAVPSYIGRVSYTIYLSHHLLLELVQWQWPQLGTAATLLLAGAMSLLAAEAMRRWIEQPCLRLRRSLHRPQTPPADAATASLANPA